MTTKLNIGDTIYFPCPMADEYRFKCREGTVIAFPAEGCVTVRGYRDFTWDIMQVSHDREKIARLCKQMNKLIMRAECLLLKKN